MNNIALLAIAFLIIVQTLTIFLYFRDRNKPIEETTGFCAGVFSATLVLFTDYSFFYDYDREKLLEKSKEVWLNVLKKRKQKEST